MSTEYDNPDDKEKLDQARQQLQQKEQTDQIEESVSTKSARQTVAEEDQPYADLPQPQSKTVQWRGKDLDFQEMGESLATIVRMEQDDDRSEADMLSYVCDVFGEKCQHPAADRDYWSQFDLFRDDDLDGLLDLFTRLTGGEDITPEEREEIEQFRNE